MLRYCLILSLLIISSACGHENKKAMSQTPSDQTTYYFIRHAEKDLSDPSNRNPKLTEQGEQRAQEWMTYFKNKNIQAVYSTNYERTMNTALPTSNAFGLIIRNYDPSKLYTEEFQAETKGKNVLIVGHSNTTPAFVNKVLGKSTYTDIDESEYGHLYRVSQVGDRVEVSHEQFD